MAAAQAAAGVLGAVGWAEVELLLAVRTGMVAGAAANRAAACGMWEEDGRWET
jgi:hypothetical protein